MAQTAVKFVSGVSRAIDHTPAAAVTAGDVVVQGGLAAVSKLDIAANALGALHVGGVWDFPLVTGGSDVTVGADVYWDANGSPVSGTALSGAATATSTGNTYLGRAIPKDGAAASANAAAATDAYVRVLMCEVTPDVDSGS